MKKKLILLLSILPIYISAQAGGGSPFQMVYDPWNEIQNSTTAVNSATQLVNQAKELQYELDNFKNYDGNTTQWNQILPLLQQLGQVAEQGNAISYSMSNINDRFKEKYPGYKPEQDYDQAYQGWSSTTMDTLQNSLQSNGLQAREFSTEQNRLDKLKVLSSSASGRMQATQAGNMIAAEEVGQTQQLRQLVMNQTNSQNAYMAYKVQKDQAQQAASKKLFQHPRPYPKYGTGRGFGSGSLPNISN